MNKFFDIISSSSLFEGIAANELTSMLSCLDTHILHVKKGNIIFSEGDPVESMGLVLDGCIQIERSDFYGNRSIIVSLAAGELFAEMFACAGIDTMPVSAVAASDSVIMLMHIQRILTTCTSACVFHKKLIENLLHSVARKTLSLNNKIHCISQRSTREKLMTYLLECAKRTGSSEFIIPFDRQGLADYLCVERSAMSAEISRMRKDLIIETKGSWFRLLRKNCEI